MVFVRVDITSEADNHFEGPETFTLIASYNSGGSRSASGIATIVDNGSGSIYKEDLSNNKPVLDLKDLDDDRGGLSIPDVTVNEESPYVVFKVSANSGQAFTLALSNGATGFTTSDAIATASVGAVVGDYTNNIELYNGSKWITYQTGSQVTVPQGGSLLLVRVPIIDDAFYEGAHAFTLTATASHAIATGVGIIGDFGTGAIFNDSGAENRFAVKDDDRQLKVDSPIVNEASNYVVYTITGITADDTELAMAMGNGTGFATVTPNLQYWTGLEWRNYAGGTIAKPSNGELLVRVNIQEEQDAIREGWERLDLQVKGSGGPTVGCASIRDDGSGVIYVFDGSNQSGQLSGISTANLDDDFDKDGILPTTEEALASLAASQGIGNAKDGDMNGDGIADADQNALATLAWTNVKSFDAGNDGTLTDSKPIISITITDSNSGSNVSQSAQLENIRVTSFNDNSTFDSATANSVSYANPADKSGIRTVTLADGSSTKTPWDPIQFDVVNQADIQAILNDIDATRSGTQIRLYIDISAASLNQGEFNAYIKYVSDSAIKSASTALVDLDGKPITKAGWYDFTQRTPGGDGARFIINNGKIVGIELIITDNAFGDDDMTANRIFDPGVPVKSNLATDNEISPNASQIVDFNSSSGLNPNTLFAPQAFDNLQINYDAAIKNDNYPWSPTVINWPGISLNHNIDQFHQTWGETRSEIMEISLSAVNKNGVFNLPPEALIGLDTNDSLKFDASLADGNELPNWIIFDRNSGSVALAKDAPNLQDSTKIIIVATDTKSNQVAVKVILKPKVSGEDKSVEKKALHHSLAAKLNDKPLAKQSLSEQIQQTSTNQRLQRDATNFLDNLSQIFR